MHPIRAIIDDREALQPGETATVSHKYRKRAIYVLMTNFTITCLSHITEWPQWPQAKRQACADDKIHEYRL